MLHCSKCHLKSEKNILQKYYIILNKYSTIFYTIQHSTSDFINNEKKASVRLFLKSDSITICWKTDTHYIFDFDNSVRIFLAITFVTLST